MASAPAFGAYLLDSSVLILSLRGDNALRAHLAATSQLFIPSTVLGELYFGAYGSPTQRFRTLLRLQPAILSWEQTL